MARTLARPLLEVHAREGAQGVPVRPPGDERELGGAVVVVHPQPRVGGSGGQGRGEPVAGDDDHQAGRGAGVQQPGEGDRGEHGMGRARR